LAKLHSTNVTSVNLDSYGKTGDFYTRQIKTWTQIYRSQSPTKDKETGVPVGDLPYLPQMIPYLSAHLPHDRTTIVHGDFKIDNLIYHPTEPKVIGILDWEMSTLGHPLSDLSNLLMPYAHTECTAVISEEDRGFLSKEGMLTRDEAVSIYGKAAGWDPKSDMLFGFAFGFLRVSVLLSAKSRSFGFS